MILNKLISEAVVNEEMGLDLAGADNSLTLDEGDLGYVLREFAEEVDAASLLMRGTEVQLSESILAEDVQIGFDDVAILQENAFVTAKDKIISAAKSAWASITKLWQDLMKKINELFNNKYVKEAKAKIMKMARGSVSVEMYTFTPEAINIVEISAKMQEKVSGAGNDSKELAKELGEIAGFGDNAREFIFNELRSGGKKSTTTITKEGAVAILDSHPKLIKSAKETKKDIDKTYKDYIKTIKEERSEEKKKDGGGDSAVIEGAGSKITGFGAAMKLSNLALSGKIKALKDELFQNRVCIAKMIGGGLKDKIFKGKSKDSDVKDAKTTDAPDTKAEDATADEAKTDEAK